MYDTLFVIYDVLQGISKAFGFDTISHGFIISPTWLKAPGGGFGNESIRLSISASNTNSDMIDGNTKSSSKLC